MSHWVGCLCLTSVPFKSECPVPTIVLFPVADGIQIAFLTPPVICFLSRMGKDNMSRLVCVLMSMTMWLGVVAPAFASLGASGAGVSLLQKEQARGVDRARLIDPTLSLGVLTGEKAKAKKSAKKAKLPFGTCLEPGACVAGSHPVSRVVGLVLNIFLPFAIGSWAVGDFRGGTIGLFGQLGGFGLMLIGEFLLEGFLAPAGALVWVIGIILATVGYVVPMFTVLLGRHRGYANAPQASPKQDFFARGLSSQRTFAVHASF